MQATLIFFAVMSLWVGMVFAVNGSQIPASLAFALCGICVGISCLLGLVRLFRRK